MKLVSFGVFEPVHPGVYLADGSVVPIEPILGELGLPIADMSVLIGMLPALRTVIEDAIADGATRVPLDQRRRLGPPVPRPRNIFMAGANYQSHLEEGRAHHTEIPTDVIFFQKPAASLGGPNDDIVRPRGITHLDYEAELAFVVGKKGRRISKEEAPDYIAGYMISNDVSFRQRFALREKGGKADPVHMDTMRIKGWETFLPTGPWLVTPDELGPWHDIRIDTRVNGERRQSSPAGDMTFSPYELLEKLSEVTTVYPGDIVTTGTPAGVGAAMDPPRFLGPGDTVQITMTGLGSMETNIRDEAA